MSEESQPIYTMRIGHMKWISIVIALSVFLCDRILKILANKSLLRGVLGLVHFTRLHNYGATMGFLRGDRTLLVGIGLIVVAILVTTWFKSKSASILFWLGWALLMGGTIGNLVDRLMYGYVTDMLKVPLYPAVFNLADVAIRTGIVVMLIGYLRSSSKVPLKNTHK